MAGSCKNFFILFLLVVSLAACGEARKPLKIGDPAPDFTARDLEGNTVSLKSYLNRPVVLRFWSTECKFCRADTPIFNRYFDQYKDQGLRVIYINTESTAAQVRKFVEDLEIIFPVVPEGKEIAKKYGIKLVPQTIVLDPGHRIIAAILGGVSEGELQDLIGPFLSAPRPE